MTFPEVLVDGLIPAVERQGGSDGLAFLLALGSIAPEPVGGQAFYRVKVSLRGAKPPIWRRLEVPTSTRPP